MNRAGIAGLLAAVLAAGGCPRPGPGMAEDDPMARLREDMVQRTIVMRGVADPRVLDAMRTVPRHEFVPPDLRDEAYADYPLPIGLGQTISQPYIVAAMTELMKAGPDERVLEIGTGSGYQAAVLAMVAGEVYTIEILPELAHRAAELLPRLGYTNISVRAADGYLGWPERSPFDAIMVTCGATHVPQPLLAQLKPGGRMVIPVGENEQVQSLKRLTKRADGGYDEENVLPVGFVPLTGPHAEGR